MMLLSPKTKLSKASRRCMKLQSLFIDLRGLNRPLGQASPALTAEELAQLKLECLQEEASRNLDQIAKRGL